MAKQTRYFKATDGTKTVFRASPTKEYQFANMDGQFTALPPRKPGYFLAVEITKAEYDALVAAKMERLKASGRNLRFITPSNSWVSNASL